MPFYFVTAQDRAGALDDRLAHRQAHIDYWSRQSGTVKIGGAILANDSPAGSALLIEASDEGAVRALVAADPFMIQGVFAGEMQIVPMRPAIGDWFPA